VGVAVGTIASVELLLSDQKVGKFDEKKILKTSQTKIIASNSD